MPVLLFCTQAGCYLPSISCRFDFVLGVFPICPGSGVAITEAAKKWSVSYLD